MAPTVAILFSRDSRNCTLTEDGFLDENSCYVPFWATRTGIIVKWTLFLGIIVIVGLYLLLGHIHAQRRIRKGLPPLAYHRFLVSRATLAQVDPRYRYPQPANIYPYRPDNQFDMHAMPPPVYDPNAPRPPKYEPPAGSTKVDQNQPERNAGPTQTTGEPPEYAPPAGPPPRSGAARDTYAPPPGPPPSTVRPQGTGNTNPFWT